MSLADAYLPNVLFICSKNQWRSRTAESIFRNDNRFKVRSAGTEKNARIRLTQNHLDWANIVFVMEQKHKVRVQTQFAPFRPEQELIVLDIPDDYPYLDSELIFLLEEAMDSYF